MKSILVLAGFVLMIACFVISTSDTAQAWEILGVGTESLLGGDITDPEDDGAPDSDDGYDVIFSSNDEPGFGGGEFSYNVFDNRLGPSNDKWCCGPGGGIPEEGLHITVELEDPQALTHFTVSSANDVPTRDPTNWAIQGSKDGENFTDIFTYEGDSLWGAVRFQVIFFEAPEDFDAQTTEYTFIRFVCYDTVANPAGAYYQVGEIEYFVGPGAAVDSKAKLTATWGSLKNNR
jgi:hypothetical protein